MVNAGKGLLEERRTYAVLAYVSWLRARREFGCWLAVLLYMPFDCCAGVPLASPESKSQRATRRCGLVSQRRVQINSKRNGTPFCPWASAAATTTSLTLP